MKPLSSTGHIGMVTSMGSRVAKSSYGQSHLDSWVVIQVLSGIT